MSDDKPAIHPRSLLDILRERSAQRPAASSPADTQWELVHDGIRPIPPVAVDCKGSAPEFDDACHNKPVWVIETEDGYHPTCLTHSGRVLNSLLIKYRHDTEVAMYFHPYKGT